MDTEINKIKDDNNGKKRTKKVKEDDKKEEGKPREKGNYQIHSRNFEKKL